MVMASSKYCGDGGRSGGVQQSSLQSNFTYYVKLNILQHQTEEGRGLRW